MLTNCRRLLPVVILAWILPLHVAWSATPADQLLPDSTTGFLSIGDLNRLEQNWDKCRLGQFTADAAMQDFIEDVKKQWQNRAGGLYDRLGMRLADLDGVASGEVALALVEPKPNLPAVVVLADVTGNDRQVEQLFAKMDRNLTQRGGTKKIDRLGTTQLRIYNVPPREKGQRRLDIIVFVRDNVLCATGDRSVAEAIHASFAQQSSADRLASVPAYQATLKQCRDAAQGFEPDFRWFIEPFSFSRGYKQLRAERGRKVSRKRDFSELLANNGYDAIKGMGGFVNFHAPGGLEMLHRTSVYLPASGSSNQQAAFALLDFPARGDLLPESWVPADLASYTSFNWHIREAFEHVGPLVNDYSRGENNFEDALEGIARGEHGPQVDIRKEIIANLRQRVSVVTDYELPITPKSERFVFVIEAIEEAALADALQRFFEADKWREQQQFQGHTIWVTMEKPIDDPIQVEVQDDDPGDFQLVPFDSNDDEEMEPVKPSFPRSAFCVADGRLWIASHVEFLHKVLQESSPGNQLGQALDFAQVRAAIGELAPESLCMRSFSRGDVELRATYELLRNGQMPEAETLLGRMLNEIFANEEGLPREQKLDGSKLPPFEEVKQYFGPSGVAVTPGPQGWFIVGAVLNSDGPDLASRPKE